MADVVEEVPELTQGKMPQAAPVFRLPSPSACEEPAARAATSPPSPRPAAGVGGALPSELDIPRACGGCGDDGGNRDGGRGNQTTRQGRKTKAVRFSSVEISAIWNACSAEEYNRRSIVVDLSKTPFALFRRDAVMMKQARTLSVSAPLPPPAPPALPAQQAVSLLGAGGKESPSSSPPPSLRRRSGRLWDVVESSSSSSSEGHTDMETDDTETDWHSDDADSVCSASESSACLVDQQLRRGSNTSESGPAFYGVWRRTSSEGYEEMLLKSGVPKRAVAVAMKKHPVHIIDHDGSYFRLIVKNGLSKVDNTFWIGEEPKQDMIGEQSYEVSMNWAHLSGHGSEDELALSSVCHKKGEEVIAIRSLLDGGSRMVLTQIVRRPAEKYEVRAKHFFKRVTSKSELRGTGREQKQHLSSTVVTATQPQQFSSVVAGCAFCGGHAGPSGSGVLRRRTRGLSSSRSSSRSSSSSSSKNSPAPPYSPLLLGRHVGGDGACRSRTGVFVAAARRWQGDGGEDADEDEDPRARRGGGRKPLRAPWEDIQWSNPETRGGRGGGERVEWEDREEDESDEDVLGLGERRSKRANLRDCYDDDRPRRRRMRADDLDLDAEPIPSGWDASGWFSGAQQANQGGLFDWARSFYNTLFWYGGASSEDTEELPAMNFQDLLERYDLPAIEQSSARPRPIVPPEDLAAEQDFRWRPSGRDSTAARATGERTTPRRRAKPRSSSVNGGVPASSMKRRARGHWEREPERGEGEEFGRREASRRVAGGAGGGGSRRDAAAIGQLRWKQRQLADREHQCEVDLEKVRERLDVVDATVELWMRRSAGMLSRGGSETDTDVLQAKRRIYGLKDEGKQLDSATVELEGRLEDCRAKLDRIVQELELLGEDAVPQAFYTPLEDEGGEFDTTDEGTQTPQQGAENASGLEAKVVGMEGLRLEPEKERDVEAVPAVGEADA
eukprot:g8763.t1